MTLHLKSRGYPFRPRLLFSSFIVVGVGFPTVYYFRRGHRLLASYDWSLFLALHFLGRFATFASHARLSYSSAYTAYDGGVMALSEIVVD